MVLNEWGDEWVIKIYEGDEPPPLGLCAGGQHAHESWPEYRKCYSDLGEKYAYWWELRDLRGTKMHDLCRVCVDIFADHAEAECLMGPGFENPSLLGFWDNAVGSFVRFIGTMVEHVLGAQTGPCPLCKVQEDQHDYATCLQTVSLEMKGDELSVTTNRPLPRNPQPDPNLPWNLHQKDVNFKYIHRMKPPTKTRHFSPPKNLGLVWFSSVGCISSSPCFKWNP